MTNVLAYNDQEIKLKIVNSSLVSPSSRIKYMWDICDFKVRRFCNSVLKTFDSIYIRGKNFPPCMIPIKLYSSLLCCLYMYIVVYIPC